MTVSSPTMKVAEPAVSGHARSVSWMENALHVLASGSPPSPLEVDVAPDEVVPLLPLLPLVDDNPELELVVGVPLDVRPDELPLDGPPSFPSSATSSVMPQA
jgi:hypothetical protein